MEDRARPEGFQFGCCEAAHNREFAGPQPRLVADRFDPQAGRRGWCLPTGGAEHQGLIVQQGPAVGAEIGCRPGAKEEDRTGGLPAREAIEIVEGSHDLADTLLEERGEQRRAIDQARGSPHIDRRKIVAPEDACAVRQPLGLDRQRPVGQETA